MEAREDRWAAAMRAALDGDGAAYERLLGEVAAMLRGLARARLVRMGLGPDEAEDIVQEVLMALHRRRGTWDPSRPFLPWLYGITEYKLIDAARRLGRTRRRTVGEPVEDMAERLAAPPRPELALARRSCSRPRSAPSPGAGSSPGRTSRRLKMLDVRALSLAALCALGTGPALAAPEWVDYAPEAFAAAQEEGETMLVDVTADWCPTCRAQKPILEELRAEESLDEVVFVRVDFDVHKDFLQAHNVPRQSTILIFDGETEVARSVAETDRDRLRSFVFDAVGD